MKHYPLRWLDQAQSDLREIRRYIVMAEQAPIAAERLTPLLELEGGERVSEVAAILQVIADRVPTSNLAPAAGTRTTHFGVPAADISTRFFIVTALRSRPFMTGVMFSSVAVHLNRRQATSPS